MPFYKDTQAVLRSTAMSHLKRIIYVIGSLEVGGAERHLLKVAIALKALGYSPEIFSLNLGGPLTKPLTEAGIPIHGFAAPAWLRKLIRHERTYAWVVLALSSMTLLRVLWFRRPQVVHFFLPAAYIIGGIVSLLSPVRVRIMSRRSLNNYQEKHRLFARIERRLHGRMHFICGNSQAILKQLVAEGAAHDCLRLIYNGIEAAPAASDAPCSEPPRPGPVFIIVANLIPYKGHADLLEAFALIDLQLPSDWTLLCAGRDDGIGEGLRRQAAQLGIADHIRFLGSRSDVHLLLQDADVGVLCSHEEGFSNAVLEGMAAGLPMVVTDVGGNAEAVVDGETGYVVPAKNPQRLAEALLAAALDPNRAQMGLRGRQRVERYFTMKTCVDGYESLYQEAAALVRTHHHTS